MGWNVSCEQNLYNYAAHVVMSVIDPHWPGHTKQSLFRLLGGEGVQRRRRAFTKYSTKFGATIVTGGLKTALPK